MIEHLFWVWLTGVAITSLIVGIAFAFQEGDIENAVPFLILIWPVCLVITLGAIAGSFMGSLLMNIRK